MLNPLQLNCILEDFDIAYWKINLLTSEIIWSDHFEALIGKSCTQNYDLSYFLNNILHQDYKYDFRSAFENLSSENNDFNQEIKLKLQNDKYRWFECR